MKGNRSSTILTFLGAIGVVGTAVLTAMETPKVTRICKELKELYKHKFGEEPKKLDYVKVAWKCYIPAALVGASTIVCIFSANTLSRKQQAALVSAYTLADNAYREYKSKTRELYGEEADVRISEAMAQDDYDKSDIRQIEPGNVLFYDPCIGYFASPLEFTTLDDGLECYIIEIPSCITRKSQQVL